MDIQRFHKDLKAAAFAGVPLELSDRWKIFGGTTTVNTLDSLERTVAPALKLDVDATQFGDAVKSVSGIPGRYSAAIRTYVGTNTMTPVLNGLTSRKIAQQEVARSLRWAFVYLFFLLSVALAGLILYWWTVVPAIQDMRADIVYPIPVQTPVGTDVLTWVPFIIATLSIGLVCFLLWVMLGGISRIAMWAGGRQYVRCRTSATALQNVQMLVDGGMEMDEALNVSCDLAGLDTKARAGLFASVEGQAGGEYLRELADYFQVTANQRLAYLKVATPIFLVAAVGGLVSAAYCIAIYWPVVSILYDLISKGAGT